MKTPTLEEYVKVYVQNKARSEAPAGFEEWLRENGVNSEGIYAAALKDATVDYEMAKSEYGSRAERLGALGLSGSGYSDYLNGRAYAELQASRSRAKSAYRENERLNKSEYAKYIEERKNQKNEAYKGAVNEISDAGIMNYDTAYEYAIGMGLDGDSAAEAAKSATEAVRIRVIDGAIKAILANRFDENQAKEYALLLGLGEEEAERLGKYADKINVKGYYSQDYLDYLKSKEEK